MNFGMMSWEDMMKIEGTDEYNGVCKDYDTAPENYLWIAAIYTGLSTVVLGGVLAILFWVSMVFTKTLDRWKIFLFLDLLFLFGEMLTIVFYLFGLGCLGNKEGDLRCSISDGAISAIISVVSIFLTYITLWIFSPVFYFYEDDKSTLSESIESHSKGIEMQAISKLTNQTDEIKDAKEPSPTMNGKKTPSLTNLGGRLSSKRKSLSGKFSSKGRRSSTSTFGIEQFLEDEDFWDGKDMEMKEDIVNQGSTSLCQIQIDTHNVQQDGSQERTILSSIDLDVNDD